MMLGIEAKEGIWTGLNAFSGAGLGASFYVLLKTQPYLINRSYDPKYNAAYISRFITGLIGGVILATAIGPMLGSKLQSIPGGSLTPGVLAILGGYAAEAVEQILQRLVEVVLALVRGDNSAQTQAKVVAEQVTKNAKVQELLPELLATRGSDDEFKATLQKVKSALKLSTS